MTSPEPRSPTGGRAHWALAALALFGIWALATYLLEGRIRTLLRPEDTGARFVYALVANVAIGLVATFWLIRRAVRAGAVDARRLGFRGAPRTAVSVGLGLAAGLLLFLAQDPPTTEPMVLLNAYAQVWVVSVAEILVCWVALGGLVRAFGGSGTTSGTVLAWLVAAAAFGLYHFAHSPPFNAPGTVGLLAGVGLVTGGFFFGVGEVYGTIVFHNFMALRGVTQALAEAGRIDDLSAPRPAILGTALLVTALVILLGRAWLARERGGLDP